jgi:hypothetical protein
MAEPGALRRKQIRRLCYGVTNTAFGKLPAGKGDPGIGAREPSELML